MQIGYISTTGQVKSPVFNNSETVYSEESGTLYNIISRKRFGLVCMKRHRLVESTKELYHKTKKAKC